MNRFAKRVFTAAGLYGFVVLVPLYFLEGRIGRDLPPAITHPEYFYGFIGVALAWQLCFLVIGRDPERHRALMPASMVEKLVFGIPAVVLYLQGRLATSTLGFGMIDFVWGALFLAAYRRTPAR